MTFKELIPILAECFGVPFKTAWVIDRSLADASLRKKHKGPNPPDMTRLEALYFLVGCLVAINTPTKAGEMVTQWLGAKGFISRGKNEDIYDFMDENGEFDDTRKKGNKTEFKNYTLRKMYEGVDLDQPAEHGMLADSLPFFDALLRATNLFGSKQGFIEGFELQVCYSHNYAKIVDIYDDEIGEIFFQNSVNMDEIISPDSGQISRVSSICGSALHAIACRTECQKSRLEDD